MGQLEKSSRDALLNIASETGAEIRRIIQEFGDKMVGDAKRKPSRTEAMEWKGLLGHDMERRKQKLNRVMDQATEKGMDVVQGLPDNQQESGAEQFTAWLDYMVHAARKVMEFFNKAFVAVMDTWYGVAKGENVHVDSVIKSIQKWSADSLNVVKAVDNKAADIFER